jgi:hypothetical protein
MTYGVAKSFRGTAEKGNTWKWNGTAIARLADLPGVYH